MLKKIFFILIGLINILIASSQTDTITYAECEIDTTPNQYDKLLKYFIVDKEDVNHLWKFNAVDWGALNPSIAFEQRILKRSSVEFESLLKTYRVREYFNIGMQPMIRGEINADYRFYYNKRKREKKGKPTNGFSGNYMFLGGGLNINNRPDIINEIGGVTNRKWDFGYSIKSGIGIQRRIGNIAYADIKFGFLMDFYDDLYYSDATPVISPSLYSFNPYIDINLGLGLISLKRPLFK